MKRSDMARRIQEMLDGEFYDPRGYGYQILRVVEALGMAPPLHSDLYCAECDDGLAMRKWEPES